MQIAARFQQGFDQLRHDTRQLVREMSHSFRNMSDETAILLFVMFIMGLFYLIVRRPNDAKESGSMGRQFVFALAIILIFSAGISWMIDDSRMTVVTRL